MTMTILFAVNPNGSINVQNVENILPRLDNIRYERKQR